MENINNYCGYIGGPEDTTGVPAAYQPTWLNKQNKVLMDAKLQPRPAVDKAQPTTAHKITPNIVKQQNILMVAGMLLGLIRNAGIEPPADLFCLYQMYHETQGFTSPLFLHYNASGIKYAGQYGATKQPTGLPYAWFNSWPDYMTAYKHEMTKGANPIGATNLEDFATRLKTNKYYEVSYDSYLKGLYNAKAALAGFVTGAASYEKPENKIMAWFKNLPWWGKGLVILGTVVTVKKIAE